MTKTTKMLQINFLDGHPPIDVEERPAIHIVSRFGGDDFDVTDLSIGWGDREAVKGDGPARMLPPRVYVTNPASMGSSSPMVAISAEELARVQAIIDRLWIETPTVAPACEPYRLIVQSIIDEHARHYLAWDSAEKSIAHAFRRRAVVLGEQTVPSKVCVRSTRGRLLGYALLDDRSQWSGRIERV